MTRGGAHQERHLLAPAVQNMDSTIHWINLYPVDSTISFPKTCLLDSDLSGGQRPSFEQPELMLIFVTLSLRLHWTPTQLFSVLSLINTSPQRNLQSSFSLERSIT